MIKYQASVYLMLSVFSKLSLEYHRGETGRNQQKIVLHQTFKWRDELLVLKVNIWKFSQYFGLKVDSCLN